MIAVREYRKKNCGICAEYARQLNPENSFDSSPFLEDECIACLKQQLETAIVEIRSLNVQLHTISDEADLLQQIIYSRNSKIAEMRKEIEKLKWLLEQAREKDDE